MFTSAKKEKISTVICNQIRSAIVSGRLKPGEALPPEKELMEQFDVGKHTLREALRALEVMGFITIRRGVHGGPVISEIDWKIARDYFSAFLHLQHNSSSAALSEVRSLIEPYIAHKAACDFTDEQIEELEAVHAQCVKLIAKGQGLLGAHEEIQFHVLLAKHTGNAVLWVIMDFINNMLADAKKLKKPGMDFSQKVLAAHQKILDAIKARSPELAESRMRAHISEVEADLNLLSG